MQTALTTDLYPIKMQPKDRRLSDRLSPTLKFALTVGASLFVGVANGLFGGGGGMLVIPILQYCADLKKR